MKHALILYGTEGCHLCDEAQTLLDRIGLTWHDVDIADDDELLERYGTSIPVLARSDSSDELNWPFQREDVLTFLRNAVK